MFLSSASIHLLNTSTDEASITSLGSLFQCFTTLSVKKFFLITFTYKHCLAYKHCLSFMFSPSSPHQTLLSAMLLHNLYLQELNEGLKSRPLCKRVFSAIKILTEDKGIKKKPTGGKED